MMVLFIGFASALAVRQKIRSKGKVGAPLFCARISQAQRSDGATFPRRPYASKLCNERKCLRDRLDPGITFRSIWIPGKRSRRFVWPYASSGDKMSVQDNNESSGRAWQEQRVTKKIRHRTHTILATTSPNRSSHFNHSAQRERERERERYVLFRPASQSAVTHYFCRKRTVIVASPSPFFSSYFLKVTFEVIIINNNDNDNNDDISSHQLSLSLSLSLSPVER